jgi:hypothetical protein
LASSFSPFPTNQFFCPYLLRPPISQNHCCYVITQGFGVVEAKKIAQTRMACATHLIKTSFPDFESNFSF